MEFGETPEQALRREFLEELNATFAKMTLLDNFTNVHHIPEHQGKEAYLYHRIALIYQIEGLSMHSCSSNEELLAFEWLNLDEIDERTVSPLVRDVMSWLKIRLTL
jgi:8-oxo-dGTP pyrophosphatase MutT (NUDIX family)